MKRYEWLRCRIVLFYYVVIIYSEENLNILIFEYWWQLGCRSHAFACDQRIGNKPIPRITLLATIENDLCGCLSCALSNLFLFLLFAKSVSVCTSTISTCRGVNIWSYWAVNNRCKVEIHFLKIEIRLLGKSDVLSWMFWWLENPTPRVAFLFDSSNWRLSFASFWCSS